MKLGHFWNFGTPNISGTVESSNFKFVTEMDGIRCRLENSKFGHRGHMWSRDPLFEFLVPLTAPELFKLDTSNLAKMQHYVKMSDVWSRDSLL